MAFIPSTDRRPVYFDINGAPMVSGKLEYFEQGWDAYNPNSPVLTPTKQVFTDYQRTVPALNPQLLNISARTDTQIFLTEGPYTVAAFRFIGVDPNTAPSSDWVYDHKWDEDGLPVSNPAAITDILNVPNMAALAAVDPLEYTRVNVLGYYAEGDMFPRFYTWNASNNGPGNGGTVVKYGTSSAGAWEYDLGPSAVLDARIFGALPSSTNSLNGAISAAVLAADTASIPVYLPAGTYKVSGDDTQYVNGAIKIDRSVYFNNVSAGTTYTLQINGTYDISALTPLKSSSSVGEIGLKFNNSLDNSSVRATWYGNPTGNSVALLKTVVAGALANYELLIDQRYVISTATEDLTIPHRLRFLGNGRISNNQTSFSVIFTGPGSITNQTTISAPGYSETVRGVLHSTLPTGLSMLKFTDYNEIRSSWFANDSGNGETIVLNPVLRCFPNVTKGTRFVLDHPTNLFDGTSVTSLDTENVVFTRESGLLKKTTASSGHIVMANCQFDGAYLIQSYGFVVGGQVNRISNWLPVGATATQSSVAWKNAVDSALVGNNILDLGNKTITLNQATSMTSTSGSATIRNGIIAPTSNFPVLSFATAITSLKLLNINLSSNVNSPLVQVTTGGSIGLLTIDSNYGSCAGDLIQITGTGTITACDIGGSILLATNIVNASTGLSNLNIHDNPSLSGDLITDRCCVIANNNKINGGSVGVWQAACYDSTIFTGNRFYQCDLKFLDNNGYLDAVATGNQFESTDTKVSRIWYKSRTINTVFSGAIATGNSFTGTLTNTLTAIILDPLEYGMFAGGGDVSYWSNRFMSVPKLHNICLSDNTTSSDKIIVPVTRGPVPVPFFDRVDDSTARVFFYKNPGIFYLPASSPTDTVKLWNVAPSYTSLSGVPFGTVPYYKGHDFTISGGSSNQDYMNMQFVGVHPAGDMSMRLWGLSVNLYNGKQF